MISERFVNLFGDFSPLCAARLVLVRHVPGFGTPRRWRRYSVCVNDANFHPARAMSDVSKHNRMEFVDFPPSLFSPLSLCTKLLLPVSPLCLPARWGKILNIFQMVVQVPAGDSCFKLGGFFSSQNLHK